MPAAQAARIGSSAICGLVLNAIAFGTCAFLRRTGGPRPIPAAPIGDRQAGMMIGDRQRHRHLAIELDEQRISEQNQGAGGLCLRAP
jgi:hypothetical protein